MSAILHTVNKSPFEKNSLQTCLRLSSPGSHILLIEDGVYAALKGCAVAAEVSAALQDRSVSVLGPDLEARGISGDAIVEGIGVVGYDGFVQLAADSGKVQSWM
jgi:tRNA 2-thiouridine synthesizing protein B